MERTLKDGDVVEVLPLTAEVLDDLGKDDYFICLSCERTFFFYSNTCHGQAVRPVRVVRRHGTVPQHSEFTGGPRI